MYKHYKKLIGFQFITLTEDQFNHEKDLQQGLFGVGCVMFEKETDTIVLLPVENIRYAYVPTADENIASFLHDHYVNNQKNK